MKIHYFYRWHPIFTGKRCEYEKGQRQSMKWERVSCERCLKLRSKKAKK